MGEQRLLPLAVESLTTYPLRTAELLNLRGDEITHHPAKRIKHSRASPLFHGERCESLLHVPAFKPSAAGPRPVLMLSLQNRLGKDGKLALPEGSPIYTDDDEVAARGLAEAARDALLPDMELLDMV